MRSVVMRHKKSQRFNNEPIVTMPAKTEMNLFVQFTPTQRTNYDKLYGIAKERFLYYETIHNVGRGYLDIMSSLRPARQACSGYECSAAQIAQQLADAQARTYRAREMMADGQMRGRTNAEIFEAAKVEAFQE